MEFREEIIRRINDKIGKVTDLFYKQKSQEGYQEFIGLIDEIYEFLNMIENMNSQEDCKAIDAKLRNSLIEAVEAMTNKDSVLLADILKYEVVELINGISETI